jgi:hypothetical protein
MESKFVLLLNATLTSVRHLPQSGKLSGACLG